MNIDELTIGQARSLAGLFYDKGGDGIWEIGKDYAIRTVTMIDTGTLVAVGQSEIVLENAAWVADTGRFAAFCLDPNKANEVEPFPDGRVIIGRGSIVDAVQITGKLRSVK